MEPSLEPETMVSETCVWIKEEPEFEDEEELFDHISEERDDPLCDTSYTADQYERRNPLNEEIIEDEVEDTSTIENMNLPLQPIVNLHSNDDDPELKLDEINMDNDSEVWANYTGMVDMPFQCSECYFSCFQQSNYINHMQMHVGNKEHVCPTCNKSFFFKNSFIRHIKNHKHEEIYEAMSAETNYDDNDGNDMGEENEFTCAACDGIFTSRRLLLMHIKRHTNAEPYACLVCNKKFARKVLLLRHEKTHIIEMPFACNECDIRFGDKFALAQHAITHTYEMSFSCHICNRRFWQQERLSEHMKTFHDNKKRFECEICHYKFARSQDIGRHMRSHAKPSQLECPFCTFSSKSHRVLARHAKAHREEAHNSRPYSCPLCKKKCVGKHKMISHLVNHAME